MLKMAVLLDRILQYHKRKIGASLIRKVVRCIWSDEAHGSEYLKKWMYRSWPCPYIKQPCIHLVAVPVVALTSFSQQWIQLVSESHCRLFMSHGDADVWPDALLHVVEVMEAIRKGRSGVETPWSTCDSNTRIEGMSSKNGPIRILFRQYDEGYLSCAVGDHIARKYTRGPIADGVSTSAQRK